MQGFNMGRYVPPEHEGLQSANSLHKKRPPGIRANGQQVVRFEMPFAVWCAHCPADTLIPQGVRFNATKTKVGNYYSTSIWEFGLKHADCGGEIKIRTDPKNTAYTVVSGGKKRDVGPAGEAAELGLHPTLAGELGTGVRGLFDREGARQSAFSNLEKTIKDREMLRLSSERIDALEDAQDRSWKDPYAMNQSLRKHFRVDRHAREKEAKNNDALRERLGGLSEDLAILPETEEDRRRAALVEFGVGGSREEGNGAEKALARPLFEKVERGKSGTGTSGGVGVGVSVTKAEIKAERTREGLRNRILGSARKAKDPFLGGSGTAAEPVGDLSPRMPGIKRKRERDTERESSKEREGKRVEGMNNDMEKLSPTDTKAATVLTGGTVSKALVDYDSDDE